MRRSWNSILLLRRARLRRWFVMRRHALLELDSNRLTFVDRGEFAGGECRTVVLQHTSRLLYRNLAAVHRPRNTTRGRYLGRAVDADGYIVNRVQLLVERVTDSFFHHSHEVSFGHTQAHLYYAERQSWAVGIVTLIVHHCARQSHVCRRISIASYVVSSAPSKPRSRSFCRSTMHQAIRPRYNPSPRVATRLYRPPSPQEQPRCGSGARTHRTHSTST